MSARFHHSHAEQPERDDEVRVVVVVGDEQPERVMPGQPAIERQLRVDVQRLLEVEDALGVRERSVQAQRREVGDRVVHPASHAIDRTSTHQATARPGPHLRRDGAIVGRSDTVR